MTGQRGEAHTSARILPLGRTYASELHGSHRLHRSADPQELICVTATLAQSTGDTAAIMNAYNLVHAVQWDDEKTFNLIFTLANWTGQWATIRAMAEGANPLEYWSTLATGLVGIEDAHADDDEAEES